LDFCIFSSKTEKKTGMENEGFLSKKRYRKVFFIQKQITPTCCQVGVICQIIAALLEVTLQQTLQCLAVTGLVFSYNFN